MCHRPRGTSPPSWGAKGPSEAAKADAALVQSDRLNVGMQQQPHLFSDSVCVCVCVVPPPSELTAQGQTQTNDRFNIHTDLHSGVKCLGAHRSIINISPAEGPGV